MVVSCSFECCSYFSFECWVGVDKDCGVDEDCTVCEYRCAMAAICSDCNCRSCWLCDRSCSFCDRKKLVREFKVIQWVGFGGVLVFASLWVLSILSLVDV